MTEGLSIAVAYKSPLLERLHKYRPQSYLYIPRHAEVEHFSVSGAPGSGKSTTMQHLVDSAKARAKREGRKLACVFFDPHCSFIQRYWTPGAWVGNPYDARGFSWCPTWELDLNKKRWSNARCLGMARSLYVGKQTQAANDNSSEFFTRTAQLLFNQLVVDHQPSESQELAFWMEHPDEEIATRVTGKVKADLDPGSPGQVNGINSTFSMPQLALDAIPLSGWDLPSGERHQNAPRFTIKDWGATRDRDVFLTSSADTIDALQPLQSMWIDMIFRQLIGMGERPDLPDVLIVIDELDAAQRLPMLQKAMNQLRKFNVRVILGFQARSQLDAIYGKDVATSILAACKTQIYHRSGEKESAGWEAENIGEIWYEELRESWKTGMIGGNQPASVQTELKKKFLFLPSDFMGLKDRHAVMRFENEIIRYKVALSPRFVAAPAFVSRPDAPVRKGSKRPPPEKKEKAESKSEEKPKPAGRKSKKQEQTEEQKQEAAVTNVLLPGTSEP